MPSYALQIKIFASSAKPKYARMKDSIDVLLQTFNIMGQSLSSYELADADIVIRPNTGTIGCADFEQKHVAILEGEKATQDALPLIRQVLQKKEWKVQPGAQR